MKEGKGKRRVEERERERGKKRESVRERERERELFLNQCRPPTTDDRSDVIDEDREVRL